MLQIIQGLSHTDHRLSEKVLSTIVEKFKDREAFFIETIWVDEVVDCSLKGPLMGEEPIAESEVFYEQRGDRPGKSRLVHGKPSKTNKVTVIAGSYVDEETGANYPCILYTAFGGPIAPKEPFDPSLSEDEREMSKRFWAEHALIA